MQQIDFLKLSFLFCWCKGESEWKVIELPTKFIYPCWFYICCNVYSQNRKDMFLFFSFQRIQQKNESKKNRVWALSLLVLYYLQKEKNVLSLNLRIYHFICNKASFSFSVFRKVCISSLMNAQSRLKCVCYSREAFSWTMSDF